MLLVSFMDREFTALPFASFPALFSLTLPSYNKQAEFSKSNYNPHATTIEIPKAARRFFAR
jgi:hypothetical protein